MIDLKINEDGAPNVAFCTPNDLILGKEIIYIGGNVEKLAVKVKSPFLKVPFDIRESNEPVSTLFENYASSILTHETVHIVTYKLTRSTDITSQIDRIDGDFPGMFAVCDEKR